ncbi:tyrosine-protein phosphatase Lar-like isoform X5 [Biomphalaria glabrata]|uniref:protein-tyrosine-phosphatase n=1 Tax=Biomphalaria glabrata TaxID=6526 RepID=A0A9W3AG10_BIOGL|nr:tyrosine-protein phosphatase Lar-like isoform X5 [Biomphalaria glabrata]
MGGTCTNLLAALFVATLIATFGSTTASSPPKITMAPKDVKTIDENYVSFFCKASGNPAPIIHWEKDGKKVVKIKPRLDIFEAPHISSLRIKPKLSLRDNATYTCVASNPHGEAKADATLKIYPKSESGEGFSQWVDKQETPPGYPTILTHPKLKSVEKDRPIQLACEVKGDPKPKVLWLKDNLPLDTTDARVEVLESGYLTIMHSQESDEGTYECAAENEHGVTYSYRAMVYIRVRRIAPKFNLQMPNDVKIMPGSDLNLTCVAVGSPMPYVKWRQGAKDLTSEDEAPIGRNVLILTDVRESANYTCEASSDLGNIEHMTQVIVEVLPQAPTRLAIHEKTPSSVMLRWEGDMNSVEPIRSYIIEYQIVNKGKGGEYKRSDVMELKTGGTRPFYQVTNLKPYTTYIFKVIAENSVGRSRPSNAEEATTAEIAPGSPPENVIARAISATDVSVTWDEPTTPNGVIQGYKVFYTLKPEDPVFFWDNIETKNGRSATISKLKPNVTYAISVLAFSSVGQGPLSRAVQVLTAEGANRGRNVHVLPTKFPQPIFDVPYQPLNLRAKAISPTVIDLSWDSPQESDFIKSYELYYNDSHSRQTTRVTLDPPVQNYRITNLIPDTVYHIQVSAKSSKGEGPKTPTIQVQTPAYKPEAPPENVTGKTVSEKEIQVSWMPPKPHKQNGKILGYKVFVQENNLKSDREPIMRQVSGDEKSANVKDLKTWTDYKVWVSAFTAVGDGPSSTPIIVKTDEDVPGKPKKVRVEAANSTSIMVEWDPPGAKEQNGLIRGYQVHYIEINSNDEPVPGAREQRQQFYSEKQTYAPITGLKPETRYLVQVSAFTRKGDGVRSDPRIITTKGAVPSKPRNLHVDLVQEEPPSIKATWQRPEETNGDIKNYKIIWGPQGERYEEIILNPDIYSYMTNTLVKGITYEFRVSARNDVDYGERAVATLVTPDGAPTGPPQNFTATGLTETAVRLTWDLPVRNFRNGDILMYQITYHKLSDSTAEEDMNVTSDTFKDLTNLDMNTDYSFKIRAYTSKGSGPWSNRLHFRTFGKMPPAPKNIKVRKTSETSLQVTWDEPDVPVSGYKIFYQTFYTPKMYSWEQMEVGPYITAEITNLQPFTVYAVRMQAKSVDGRYGNISDFITSDAKDIIRDDTVQKLRVTQRLTNLIKLSWEKPKLNDVANYKLMFRGIKSYREGGSIQHIVDNVTEVTIPALVSPTYTIQNLRPKTKLEFNISAIFRDGKEGGQQQLVTETLIDAPPRVDRPAVKQIKSQMQVILMLNRASERNGPISHYLVIVVPSKSGSTKQPADYTMEEISTDKVSPDLPATSPYIAARFESQSLPLEFTLGNGQEYGSFSNRILQANEKYKVFLRAYSVDPRLYTSSDFSTEIVFTNQPHPKPDPDSGPDNPRSYENDTPKDFDADASALLTIVAPTCAGAVIVIIACAVICFLLMRPSQNYNAIESRKKGKSKGELLEPEAKALMIEPAPYSIDPVEMRRQHYQTPAMISHPPIPIERLAEHIDNLKASDNFKFSQEYESIEPGQQFTWDNSNLEVNKPKNRYANVIAYDHSRVILQPMEGVPGSDYINANYMDGYRKQNAYIATQGPLPETFGDFWRMVWEQRSATIVMMTKLEERSRIKCDQYWPSRGAETYGLMHIQLVDVTELATYTIRTFHMSRYGISEKREVRQFQFTAWPDHGVPDHPTPLLMFMRRVKASNPPDAGSIIVHCSAGVGRTGAFIVIDAMLERIKHEMTVDIYGHVTCLRAQRNYMVQTEDQYIFIHDALLEAVQCGNTEVPARNLAAHIQKLTAPEPGQAITGMELEFKRLANVKASPNRFVSANLAVNKFKNRLVNILPYETTRVCLQPIRGVDGSDYINASFIDGYRYKKAYIATQGPLAETTEDFWRMLWEHNSTIIVMLTKLREMGREKCHQYWPSERSARYQYFVVDPMTEYNMPQYILREFKVTDARDGQSRTIRQFQFTDWPEQGVPKSGEGFIDFIGQVHKTKEQFGQEGPISVHCSAGVGRTGVFITLSIVLERMRYEGVVDMFQTVKMLRTQRPAMVQTEDQFQFCYRAALEYLGSFDHYAN